MIDAHPPARAADADRPIVAFDFDGTLTVRDSYTAFLRWRAGEPGYALGGLRLLPAFAAYAVWRERGALKAAATRVFLRGVALDALTAEAERFAAERAPAMLRPDALACWDDWGRRGALRVIVTASPEPVVAPFAARLGAEGLIGTRLALDPGMRLTGDFDGPNCRGREKVVRLQAAFGPHVRVRAAYGDTSGDREMLAMAQEGFLGAFTGRPGSPPPSASPPPPPQGEELSRSD